MKIYQRDYRLSVKRERDLRYGVVSRKHNNNMNCHICEGQVTEENSRLLFYPDAEMEVRICNGCIEIKIK